MSASLFSIMIVCDSWVTKVPGGTTLSFAHNTKMEIVQNNMSDVTYIDKFMVITLFQVMKHRSIVKVCQVWHIFCLLVFWWIDLSNNIFLEIFSLFWFLIDRECFVIDFIYFFTILFDRRFDDALRREREKRKNTLVLIELRYLHRWVCSSNAVSSYAKQHLR